MFDREKLDVVTVAVDNAGTADVVKARRRARRARGFREADVGHGGAGAEDARRYPPGRRAA